MRLREEVHVTGSEPGNSRRGLYVLWGLSIIVVVVLFLVPPIHQDQAYHLFADERSLAGMRNFLNVASNIPFLFVGIAGLVWLFRDEKVSLLDKRERWAYVVFAIGVALTCFGSGYYHDRPSDARLVWDRLPMTIAFMSFFSATISERLSLKAGTTLLIPLLVVGAASVFYWDVTGDLRPYVAVQFYPLVAIPLMALMFAPRYTRGSDIAWVIGFYGLAKLLEMFDSQILAGLRFISGHSLKHLSAAVASYLIIRMILKREPITSIQPVDSVVVR